MTFRFVLGCILVQRKFIGIGIGTTLVIAGVVVATGGAAGPIIAGAVIGGGSSAVISGVVTAKHGGSIADVAKSASNGVMWGAIGDSVGGVASSAAAPAITKAFGSGLKSTLATGGLTGAVGGGLTGGVMSGVSGNDAKTVLKDTMKSAAAGAAIGVASAGIGYGIKSLRSGGTTEATGSSSEVGKSGSGSINDVYDGVKKASEYLKQQGVPRQYRKQILESFDVRTIKLETAGENTYGLRFYGGNASAEGRYLFETFSPLTNRANLALPYEWNSMTGIQQFQVKSGTTMITGAAAPQSSFGGQYTGGANQWYINNLEDLIKCQ